MKLITNIKKEDYIAFWKNSPEAHFMNSYWWGQVNAKNRHQNPIYVGLIDEQGNLHAATLLMQKKTPFNMCYFYAPRGFLIDWQNKDLVKEFTIKLKKYLQEANAIYLKVDPAIIYQDIDDEANPIPNGFNNYELFNYLIELGYHHQGFNKLYEGNQPRYTFRTIFNKYQNFSEVEQSISKTFMRSIKRSYNYHINITAEKSINHFYDLILNISSKDGFHNYSKKYYEDVFNLFYPEGYIKNFEASINPEEVIKDFQEQIKTEKNQDRINKLNKDIEFLSKKPQHNLVIASLICIYTPHKAWSLYIGNDDIAEYTGTVNRLYYEFIKDAYENKLDFADLFGTVGDPHTSYKNLAGLHEYKRKIGGTYIELIGEFDLVNKPFWYHILPILLKLYRIIKH